jgi:hypothetical protein
MMYLVLTLGSALVFFNPLANFDSASGGLGFSSFSEGGGVKSGMMTGLEGTAESSYPKSPPLRHTLHYRQFSSSGASLTQTVVGLDYLTQPFKRPLLISYGFELSSGDLRSTSGNSVSSMDRLGWGLRAEGRHYFEYEGHLLYASARSILQFASYPTSAGSASGTGLAISASLGYSF